MSATLVFPVSTPDGRAYLKQALERGDRVVGASSDISDPTGGAAPWTKLPLVHEPGFLAAFLDLVRTHDITRIHASAHMVHAALSNMLREHDLADLRIINRSAWEQEFLRWDDIFARAERWQGLIAALSPSPPPDLPFLAGVIRLAFDLFGESYDDKLAALLACLQDAPDGDIVEIGALFGRSASVLLAGRALGAAERRLFVFDPWSTEAGTQQDLPEAMQAYTRAAGIERVAHAFEATFAALAPPGAMAAYRTPSASGCAIYRGDADGEAARLFKTRPAPKPCGRIALLHIDGNHDGPCAAEDVALWSPLVAPGGWVVVDDYCWRYGDGPKRAGDALLDHWGDGVAHAYVTGDCLFIQRA